MQDDSGWLSHRLMFRKDATLDRHTIDEYVTLDPLAKSSKSLADFAAREDRDKGRVYKDKKKGGDRGDGGGRGSDGNRSNARRDDGPPREKRHFSNHRGERPEVQGNWKQDRVSTADLA